MLHVMTALASHGHLPTKKYLKHLILPNLNGQASQRSCLLQAWADDCPGPVFHEDRLQGHRHPWPGFQNLGVLPEHRKMVAPAEKVGDRDDAIDVLGQNRLPGSFFRVYFSGHDALPHGCSRIESITEPRSLQESRADHVGSEMPCSRVS